MTSSSIVFPSTPGATAVALGGSMVLRHVKHAVGWLCLVGVLAGGAAGGAERDWSKAPAIIELTTGEEVVALGDVHGDYDRLATLLGVAGLIKPAVEGGYAWCGGRRILISVGDVIDKGNQGLAVIDLLMALEGSATAAGGRVIVLLGNHEAEFLANPGNRKAKREFDHELEARGLAPADVAAGRGRYGEWLTSRPLAAMVNGWFFVHGGSTQGFASRALADTYRKVVDAGEWGAQFLIGGDSILEAQKWWETPGAVDRNLGALGARHLVFGHDPGAFKPRGVIAQRFDGKVFRIDVGMSSAIDDSHGALLVIGQTRSVEEASSIDAAGARTVLWRGPK